jgi:hypothetical protein
LLRSVEPSLVEFRKAIVERRTHSELVDLCRATARCRPEKLDQLVEKLSAARKIADVH